MIESHSLVRAAAHCYISHMPRRARVTTLFFFLAALVCAKTQITHEDIWLMKQVGAPIPSPDGKWVVFSVNEPAYEEAQQLSDLWIVAADGATPPRRLTHTKAPETGVQWSPDSRRIAFSTRREGDDAAQIYILDIAAGGEAVRVTSLSTGAAAPRWRPDGQALAFTSVVYPGAADDPANQKAAAERKARKYHARVYETFPVRYWDHWQDDRQIHLFVQDLREGAVPHDLLAGTKLVANRGYDGTQTNSGEELVAAWAPDGSSLVFAATVNRTEAAYANVIFQLYQVPAAGGEPKALTSGSMSYRRPMFSPDGRTLFALASEEGNKVYYAQRIVKTAWPIEGAWTPITAPDHSATTFAITPGNKSVYFLAEDAGLEKLFDARPDGEAQVLPMVSGCYTNLAIAAKAASPVLVADWESAVNPGEIVRIDPATGRQQRLTSFNVEHAAQLDWLPLRPFWFTSSRGKRIHSMIALPPNFDEQKKYPLLVLIHGGAANMWRDAITVRWNYHCSHPPATWFCSRTTPAPPGSARNSPRRFSSTP